jgi:hypothetical protein
MLNIFRVSELDSNNISQQRQTKYNRKEMFYLQISKDRTTGGIIRINIAL